MGSGVKKDAFQNSGYAQGQFKNLSDNAANIYGSLEPTLAAEAAHPTGYTPEQKSAMNTAAQQSAGGSTAAAIGQGRLYDMRTHNAGGAKAAIGEGIRNAGANLSNSALNTEMADANMAQHNRQAATAGLQGLYGTNLSGGENALGLSNQALGVANNAKPTFWGARLNGLGGMMDNASQAALTAMGGG